MFGNNKSQEQSRSQLSQAETIIGPNAKFKGTLSSSGVLRIDGEFEGDIISTSEVIVGETGRVKAQISACVAVIAGVVNGNMNVTEKLEVLSTAQVNGDMHAGSLVIAEGAIFKGNCGMKQGSE